MAHRIVVNSVHAGYGGVRVLHGVSIELNAGETVVLLGTNGNGKSTLMKSIMGFVRPGQGEILFESGGVTHDLRSLRTEEIVNLGIVLVPEGRRLFPKLTVEENLAMGAYRAAARTGLKDGLAYCYQAFPRLAERRRQLAGSMSGGEQQMLAVARAIMSRPRFLLVDEPSTGLAPIFVSHLIEKIRELKEQLELTVLMAEQNFNQATKVADRGYIIVEGRIAFAGTKQALLEHRLVKQFYLGVS